MRTEALTLVRKDGSRSDFSATFGGSVFLSRDRELRFDRGDIIERPIPSGIDRYEILDPTYYEQMGGHWQLKVAKVGINTQPKGASINIQNFHGGQIQQGTINSAQFGDFSSKLEPKDLHDLILKLRNEMPKVEGLSDDQKAEAESYIQTLESHSKTRNPKPDFVRGALLSLKSVIEGTAAGASGTVVVALLKGWLNSHGVPV